MLRTAIIITSLLFFDIVAFSIVRPLWQPSQGCLRIAMGGRSTMELWFKHWNWPYPLRIKTTYKPWPIAYKKYATDGIYMEFMPLNGPKSKTHEAPYGMDMVKSFEEFLDHDRFDAAFFKFCFVDFSVKTAVERVLRFQDMTATVAKVHEVAEKRGIKLIVGNALPLSAPSEPTLQLQLDFNAWLKDFEASHRNVLVFDLFSRMANNQGHVRQDLARAFDDPHPADQAFSILDRAFFQEVPHWLADSL